MTESPLALEVVKISQSVDKNGFILKFRAHPQDVTPELQEALEGTRYYMVLQEMPDNDVQAERQAGERAVIQAGIFCKEAMFWKFMSNKYEHSDIGPLDCEERCATLLRDVLGIKTRADLRHNSEALKDFHRLRDKYNAYCETHTLSKNKD